VKSRASDRLADRASFSDPEVLSWCEVVIFLWKRDPAIQLEFLSIVDLYDWAQEIAETLIRSATKNSD
jgi:hypothetical protein